MTSPTLVVLAAGSGTRYGGLKQLAPLGPNDEALLEYSAFDAQRAGFGSLVIVIRPEHERECRLRLAGLLRVLPARFAYQSPPEDSSAVLRRKPWGTAHAVLCAAQHLDGPFAVVNADDFYGKSAYESLFSWFQSLNEVDHQVHQAAVMGYPVGNTLPPSGPVSRAILEPLSTGLTGSSYKLASVTELAKVWRTRGQLLFLDGSGRPQPLEGNEFVSMNMWGFPRQFLQALATGFGEFKVSNAANSQAEYLLPEAVQQANRVGNLETTVLPTTSPWCGVTYPEDDARVRHLLARWTGAGVYPDGLWG